MAKVTNNTFLLLRRACSVAAENVRLPTAAAAASATRKVVDSSSAGGEAPAGEKDAFWMRDPRSGNWIPETHFSNVDVAELREKFLCKKAKL